VICFECAHGEIHGDVQGSFLIWNSAQPVFDSVLQSNGIPLADK
jgi:hypothetical protein